MIDTTIAKATAGHRRTAMVGLRLKNSDDLRECVVLYRKLYPCGYLNDRTEHSIIIPEKFADTLFTALKINNITYYQFSVPSADSEEDVRRTRFP